MSPRRRSTTRSAQRVVVVSVVAGLAAQVHAADLKVPQQYPTLEDAQAAAEPGDRIVVTSGRHVDVTVHAPGVTVVGLRSARLGGVTSVTGPGAAIEGFRVSGTVLLSGGGNRAERLRTDRRASVAAKDSPGGWDAELRIETDGAVVRGNRIRRGFIQVGSSGRGAVVEGNEIYGVAVHEEGAVVRGNDVGPWGIWVVAAGALVEANDLPAGRIVIDRAADTRLTSNTARAIAVSDADGIVVEGNRVRNVQRTRPDGAVTVAGRRARIVGNVVDAVHTAIAVTGEAPEVSGNVVRTWNGPNPIHDPTFAIVVTPQFSPVSTDTEDEGPVVESNRVHASDMGGILVYGDRARVGTNRVVVAGRSAHGIEVAGDDSVVTENHVRGAPGVRGSGDGIAVSGQEILLEANAVTGVARDGLSVRYGNGSEIRRCDVSDVGRFGVLLFWGTSDARVTEVSSASSLVGLVNLGNFTHVADSEITGSRLVDVLYPPDPCTGCTFGTTSTDRHEYPELADDLHIDFFYDEERDRR